MSLKLATLIASLLSAMGLAQAEIEMYPMYNSPSPENPLHQNYIAMPMKRQDFGVDAGSAIGGFTKYQGPCETHSARASM